MNYRELEFFTRNGIEFEKVLARGSNGLVYLVYSTQLMQRFVIKKYPSYIFKEKDLDNITAISNPHLVKVYQYYMFNNFVYLRMEYCPSNLEQLINENTSLSKEALKNLILDVVTSVKTCHDNNVAINDFTLNNFLIDERGKIKINFLGLKHIVQDPQNFSGMCFKMMNYFLPPEVLDLNDYDEMSSDIWSLGCILFFMATRALPFESRDMKFLKEKIKNCDYNIDNVEDTNLKDIIQKCLKIDPRARSTVGNILKMRYFGNLDLSKNNQRSVMKSEWRKSVHSVRRNMTFINTNVKAGFEIPQSPFRPSETVF